MHFTTPDLDRQLREFRTSRFLAFPLAGTIAWAVVGAAGFVMSGFALAMVLFGATGSIVYMGLGLSRLTGEHAAARARSSNSFDVLFFLAVGSALLAYGIAIPFFMIEPSSLPLSVGILTGLMWLPTAWLMDHWIGVFHGVARTAGIVFLWYALPDLRWVAIPFYIVLIYAVTMVVLEQRWRRLATTARPA